MLKLETTERNIKSVGFRGFLKTKQQKRKVVQSALHAFNRLGIWHCSRACSDSGRKIKRFCFKAKNFLCLHARQCVMHISAQICISEWVKCDSKDGNVCMTGREGKKPTSSDVCGNEPKCLGRLPVSRLSDGPSGRRVPARGCGAEWRPGTVQTSTTRFLLSKQVSSDVSRQLRLLRYQAKLPETHRGLLPGSCPSLHTRPLRFPSKVKFPFSARHPLRAAAALRSWAT